MMNLINHIDFTLLKPRISLSERDAFFNTAIEKNYRGVCTFLEYYSEYELIQLTENEIKIGVVMGFPFGEQDISRKLIKLPSEVTDVDVVVNLNTILDDYTELAILRDYYRNKTLKIIIESELLDEDEIFRLSEACNIFGVDYIKSCSGFNGKLSDEKLDMMLKHRGICKIKASGGISDYSRAVEMIEKGVDVIGTSKILGANNVG
jgi:deoxyribose-phosphate aldolase